MLTWTIASTKTRETLTGSLINAIDRAAAIDAEYQPTYGVRADDADGETLWDDGALVPEVVEALADECRLHGDSTGADMCAAALGGFRAGIIAVAAMLEDARAAR
jgi:hypothetical protein